MATKSFEIESYGVHLTDSLDLGSGVIAAGATSARMRGAIACKGSDHVFFIIFLAPGSSVPEAFYRPADKLGAIFLPFGDIAPYVDLLRNEKPLTAYLDSDKPWRNGVFSALEPVGEGELFSALLP